MIGKVFLTANVSTKEYFVVESIGKMNAKVSIHNVAGHLEDRSLPLKTFNKWVRMGFEC